MSPRAASRDVAIYAPRANAFYDRAVVDPTEGGGGAEFQTTRLAAGLAERGLSVAHVVYPLSSPKPTGQVRLVGREPYRGRGGPLAKLREARAIWRSLAAADARVYILRGYGLQLIAGALFGRLRRRAVVVSGSNDIDFMPRRRSRSRLAASIYRRAIGSADAIVAQTEQQRAIAAAEYSRCRVVTIPSFAEPAEPANGPAEAFLWVGRVVDYKRPLKFVELAAALPEARFRMVAVPTSETPREMTEELRRRAAQVENLELMEPRPRPQLLELLAAATAVVLTSRFEGMPNVFLEAWMREVPVLSLGFDPDGGLARHGIGIAAGDDWGSFVEAARRLWDDPELRVRLGAAGRRYVLEAHDPAAVARQWAAMVGELGGVDYGGGDGD